MREDLERQMLAPVVALVAELDQQEAAMRAKGRSPEEVAVFVADVKVAAARRVWDGWSPLYVGARGFLMDSPDEVIRLFVDLLGGVEAASAAALVWSGGEA